MRYRLLGNLMSARAIRHVLVVDDDDGLLAAWKRSIARERTVATAKEANAALSLVQERVEESNPFDLAIIDLRLGESSGIDLIKEIKTRSPDTSIVLCSGYLSVASTVSGVHAGADLVVFKPITFREIMNRIDAHDENAPVEVDTPTLARAEWEHIMRVLADCEGNVSMAARRLGIYRSSLQRRLRKFAPRK
jgi:two-component system response regulator RegA